MSALLRSAIILLSIMLLVYSFGLADDVPGCPASCQCAHPAGTDPLDIACPGRTEGQNLEREINALLSTTDKLSSLNITNTQLAWFLRQSVYLIDLTQLRMDNNELNALPDNCLSRLGALRVFSASKNRITHLQVSTHSCNKYMHVWCKILWARIFIFPCLKRRIFGSVFEGNFLHNIIKSTVYCSYKHWWWLSLPFLESCGDESPPYKCSEIRLTCSFLYKFPYRSLWRMSSVIFVHFMLCLFLLNIFFMIFTIIFSITFVFFSFFNI